MHRKLRTLIKRSVRRLFVSGQKAGITILPYHFYSEIPNINELKKDDYWRAPSSMVGVEGMSADEQADFLGSVCEERFLAGAKGVYEKAIRENGENGGYGPIEAQFLYCFIRKHRPAKIVQIGCGVSTIIILTAAKDEGYVPEIVCVEPYPTPNLSRLAASGQVRLIQEIAQKVPLDQLVVQNPNDLFFVDSTHTVKVGSEVNRIILEVLPRLGKNVWVHFHDIYFPYDYGRNLLRDDLFFWSESSLLHAFLINNIKFRVQMSMSYIHYEKPEKIARFLPDYLPQKNDSGLRASEEGHFPSAIYLKTKDI
jgi:hypothetical protein